MHIPTIHQVDLERSFTEDQAYELVDLLIIVTAKSKNRINACNTKLEVFKNYPDKMDEIQIELNNEIQKWSDKVRRIGGTPLALFKVKIKTFGGFYTWEYPSADIEFNNN